MPGGSSWSFVVRPGALQHGTQRFVASRRDCGHVLSALSERHETPAVCCDEDGDPRARSVGTCAWEPTFCSNERLADDAGRCHKISAFECNYRGLVPDQASNNRALRLLRAAGIVRPRDLEGRGVSRASIRRLCEQGLIERVGRGLYTLPGAVLTEKHSLAEASRRVPGGVICLLSALRFHDLTTQNPHEVWMAIDHKAWRPRRAVRSFASSISPGDHSAKASRSTTSAVCP